MVFKVSIDTSPIPLAGKFTTLRILSSSFGLTNNF